MSDPCEQRNDERDRIRSRVHLSRKIPLLDEAVPRCEYYPVSIDVERRLLSFVRISRATYRNSAFLVPRWTNMGRRLYTFNLDDLLLHSMTSPLQSARTHYILISAFCCSTLLARYLDQVENCLVLKEPAIVAQLGFLRYRRQEASSEQWEAEWRRLAAMGLGLMSRAFSANEVVVIKPSDIGNCVGDVVLEHDPRSKALILSITLRKFILSVLKSDSRREWTRARVRFWHSLMGALPPLASVDIKALDDAKMSAYLWLVNNTFWASLRKKVGPERVLVLNGENVSDSPELALRRVLSFFEVPLESDKIMQIANSETASRHSKRPGNRYDAAERQADLLDWEQRFGDEADRTIEWATVLAHELQLGRIDGPVAGVAPDNPETTFDKATIELQAQL